VAQHPCWDSRPLSLRWSLLPADRLGSDSDPQALIEPALAHQVQ
jgi:hypothetical protein